MNINRNTVVTNQRRATALLAKRFLRTHSAAYAYIHAFYLVNSVPERLWRCIPIPIEELSETSPELLVAIGKEECGIDRLFTITEYDMVKYMGPRLDRDDRCGDLDDLLSESAYSKLHKMCRQAQRA